MPLTNSLRTFQHYRTTYLPNDLTAGLSVFLAGLPLCLGIALASGAPLFAGLVAGIIGGIVVGLLSDSEVSVSGPAAGLAVIVAESITAVGTFEAFLVAVILAGIIQLIMGLLKAGRLSSFFPDSVIKGMLVGIGLVIILKQIPHALGRDNDYEGEYEFSQLADQENTLSEIYRAVATASPGAVAISLIALLILIGWDQLSRKGIRFFQVVPAALVVVLVGVGLNQFFGHYLTSWYLGDSNEHMVRIPVLAAGNGLSSILDFPDFSILGDTHIYGIAVTIALVASLETLINLEAIDRIDPLRRVSSGSRELMAQGIGNILSGFMGGLPMTSVVIRTSTNVYSAGKTRLSTIIQGILLMVSVLAAGSVINHIPLASLAALLIVIGYRLARPALFAAMYREGMSQFIPFIVTVLGILFTNLLIGILVGLAVGYLFVLYTNSQASYRVIRDGKNVLIKFQRDVYFLSKPRLKETLRSFKPGDSILVDCRYANFIDRDIYALLVDYALTARTLGIDYELREVTQHKRNLPTHAAI
ncbi:SulP family inorganic anion transporter [Spirosoma fluviale]|uniref:Sulfate permease, MFS superfamily n=1 Tax=Spirosoma fluviale TaxID=1597977 RepID=A0A286F9E6_9BACT|nr:SulP family inorganic anion transporter [Spirosoma fluviale]SOD79706.1 Sulfate permease, MFS superfamily [Spirosoma fluviale]